MNQNGAPAIAEVNQELFDDSEIVQDYRGRNGALFGEATLLRDYGPGLAGKSVLDIGVGAGRTAPLLLEFKPARYVGVDYASNMVEAVRQRFPEHDFRWADAREMTDFKDGEFDFVMFSWSGIDCVGHEDRLKILREIHRVLKPDGKFIFSSANARSLPGKPWSRDVIADMELTLTPRSLIRGLLATLSRTRSYLAMRNRQIFTDDYVVILDAAHSYRLLRYAIAPDKQVTQLQSAGFGSIVAVDKKGAYRDTDDATLDDSPTYYACERV